MYNKHIFFSVNKNEAWAEETLRKIFFDHPEVKAYHDELTAKNEKSRMAIIEHQRFIEETDRKRWGR